MKPSFKYDIVEDGTGCVISSDGIRRYFVDGKLHRENGPSIIKPNGDAYWHKHNLLHREDGPAIEFADGESVWYLNGEVLNPFVTIDDFEMNEKYPALVAAMIIHSVHNN